MNASIADLTVSEQILLAASDLDRKGASQFTAEDLIVASWRKYAKTFGLKGYTDKYPDSNKVLSSIMGERGLARRGWLVKMGQKVYSLTREGRRVAARLLGEDDPYPGEEHIRLSPEKDKFLRELLASTAYRKFEEDKKHEVAFADACRFWDITENLGGEAVNERLHSVEQNLNELEQELSQADAELATGRAVTAGDVRVLRNIHRYMEDRFERVLNLLRSRATRR